MQRALLPCLVQLLLSKPALCAFPLLSALPPPPPHSSPAWPSKALLSHAKAVPDARSGSLLQGWSKGGIYPRQLESKGAERQVRLWAAHTTHPQSGLGTSPLVPLRSRGFPAGTGNGGSPVAPILQLERALVSPCLSLPSGRGAGWLETI